MRSQVTELGRRLAAPSWWLLALIVSAILVPAITKQWNDRPQELEVKTQIVRDLSESAATAVSNARFLGASALPQAHVVDVICTDEKLLTSDGKQRCAESERNEAFEAARVNMETRTGWRRASASLQARVATYFPGEADKWRAYSEAVERYLRLPTSECGQTRNTNVEKLLGYLGDDVKNPAAKQKWAPLFHLTSEECASESARAKRGGFKQMMNELSDRLLNKRQDLLESIREADAEGLSTGFNDFWDDVWPVLVVAGAIVLFTLGAWIVRLFSPRARVGRGS